MKVSVVIPVFNEQDNVPVLAEELASACAGFAEKEIVFVDDGSRDQTWARIEDSTRRFPFVKGIRCLNNRGQSNAMLAGLRESSGDILVTMDGDLQNNPQDIPKLVEKLATCDVACGYRANRKDSWSRRAGSRIGNTVRDWATHDGIIDTGCSLKAFKRECLTDLPPLNGVHRFMPAFFKINGRRIEQLPVDHRARRHGISKYTNLKRLPRTLFDLFGFLWYRKRYLGKATPNG